jgi:hypothetical protein
MHPVILWLWSEFDVDQVTQHTPMHHPLENHDDSIVDEPQLSYQTSTLVTYPVNSPTFLSHYMCNPPR